MKETTGDWNRGDQTDAKQEISQGYGRQMPPSNWAEMWLLSAADFQHHRLITQESL